MPCRYAADVISLSLRRTPASLTSTSSETWARSARDGFPQSKEDGVSGYGLLRLLRLRKWGDGGGGRGVGAQVGGGGVGRVRGGWRLVFGVLGGVSDAVGAEVGWELRRRDKGQIMRDL